MKYFSSTACKNSEILWPEERNFTKQVCNLFDDNSIRVVVRYWYEDYEKQGYNQEYKE